MQTSKGFANQLLLITAKDSATPLTPAQGAAIRSLSNYIHPVSDSHGMWLGDTAGSVSLYTPAGIQQLAHVGSGDVLVAGGYH